MNKCFGMLLVIMIAAGCPLHAQDANPISTSLRESWMNIRDLLVKMADKMPVEDYRFKPVPAVEDFGQRMAHIAGSNMEICAALTGEKKTVKFSAAPTKAEIVSGMKDTNAECDKVFNSLKDSGLGKMVSPFGQRSMLEFLVIDRFVLQHSQELYGYMAVYLRLKGIVPPSSEQNEH